VKDKDPPLSQKFVAILASKIPKQVKLASERLPIGLKKTIFEKGLKLVEKNHKSILRMAEMASPMEIVTTHTFENIIKKAKETRPELFAKWLTAPRVEHLDHAKATLLNEILKEEWIAIAPIGRLRFLAAKNDFNFATELAACWKKDPETAIPFIEILGTTDSHSRHKGRRELIIAIGKTNVREALIRYQVYAAKNGLGDQEYEMVFLEMAKNNREAFLEFALQQGPKKQKLMIILTGASMQKHPE